MTQFLNKSFSVHMAPGSTYRDNWDAVFGKRNRAPLAMLAEADNESVDASIRRITRDHKELLAALDDHKEKPPVTTPGAKEECGTDHARVWCHGCREYHLFFRATAEGQSAWEAERNAKLTP